ncbi:hypothetical protein FPOAC1_009523 [Fusarium poae]|uniref:hypothetical protein n=1 Tax=Fusarium poae TaxID=36050 RepID=UPI001CE8FB85|nr:hypothetical protein FPOAC1_009523 [Fusarium poae]KAG8670120.1 hypothetical protein FPOAC1_009523 [Fusarium poae]
MSHHTPPTSSYESESEVGRQFKVYVADNVRRLPTVYSTFLDYNSYQLVSNTLNHQIAVEPTLHLTQDR